MCFSSVFAKFTLVSMLLLFSLSVGYSNGKSKANKSKPVSTQDQRTKQVITAAIRGKEAPELIPDAAAYDALLRSLKRENVTSDVDQRRIQIQARKTGIKESNIGKLHGLAEAYSNRVTALDRRAAAIKDRALPNPDAKDIEQLEKLQQERDTLVAEFMDSLSSSLDAEDSTKLRQYVGDQVKRNITAVQIPQRTDAHTEHKKIGMTWPKREPGLIAKTAFGFSPSANLLNLVTPLQYGMGGYAYIYTESWFDSYSLTVYGRGTITQSYNSYGHTFLHTVKVRSSGNAINTTNTLGYYNSPMSVTAGLPINSLFNDGDLLDGDFILDFETTERCPASYGAYFILPTLTIQQKVASVNLKSLTVSTTNNPTGGGQTATIQGNNTAVAYVFASLQATGSVGILGIGVSIYGQPTASGAPLEDSFTPSGIYETFTAPNQVVLRTIQYKAKPLSGYTIPAGGVNMEIKLNISSGQTGVAISGADKKVTVTVTP